ncbi:MAG TPA: preprotein translocase subunit YajC [Terriglobales bacterium]|nr:preprotein translocase subunit YajC [Terriglobales bacterium]
MVSPLLAFLWMQAAPSGGNGLGLIMILAVFAIFYFLLIMPVQRRQKRVQKMHRELKAGDRVVTSGGLRGTIVSIKDDLLQIRVGPDNVKLEFVRSAIAAVESTEGTGK